jgi:hypothetical protein
LECSVLGTHRPGRRTIIYRSLPEADVGISAVFPFAPSFSDGPNVSEGSSLAGHTNLPGDRRRTGAVGQIETSGLIESKPESGRSFHLGEISVAARASRAALNAVRRNSATIRRIRIRRFVVYTKPRDERRG